MLASFGGRTAQVQLLTVVVFVIILFSRNPNVPGQKLKVKIPKTADMEKRSFVVSVPTPKVKEPELKENSFPKEFKETLFDYASAYDDWCDAQG